MIALGQDIFEPLEPTLVHDPAIEPYSTETYEANSSDANSWLKDDEDKYYKPYNKHEVMYLDVEDAYLDQHESDGSEPELEESSSVDFKITAPEPSPKSTQVDLSFQSIILLNVSDPITSA